MTTMELLKKARGAKGAMALADTERKNQALLEMARALEGRTADILAANGRDLEAARGTISGDAVQQFCSPARCCPGWSGPMGW